MSILYTYIINTLNVNCSHLTKNNSKELSSNNILKFFSNDKNNSNILTNSICKFIVKRKDEYLRSSVYSPYNHLIFSQQFQKDKLEFINYIKGNDIEILNILLSCEALTQQYNHSKKLLNNQLKQFKEIYFINNSNIRKVFNNIFKFSFFNIQICDNNLIGVIDMRIPANRHTFKNYHEKNNLIINLANIRNTQFLDIIKDSISNIDSEEHINLFQHESNIYQQNTINCHIVIADILSQLKHNESLFDQLWPEYMSLYINNLFIYFNNRNTCINNYTSMLGYINSYMLPTINMAKIKNITNNKNIRKFIVSTKHELQKFITLLSQKIDISNTELLENYHPIYQKLNELCYKFQQLTYNVNKIQHINRFRKESKEILKCINIINDYFKQNNINDKKITDESILTIISNIKQISQNVVRSLSKQNIRNKILLDNNQVYENHIKQCYELYNIFNILLDHIAKIQSIIEIIPTDIYHNQINGMYIY